MSVEPEPTSLSDLPKISLPVRTEAEAIVEEAARELKRRKAWAVATGVSTVILLSAAFSLLTHFNPFGGLTYPAGLAGAAIATALQVRRARRRMRRFADPEAIALLEPLKDDPRQEVRELVRPLLKQLNPQGTEATPADAPAGTGSEPAPASQPPAMG